MSDVLVRGMEMPKTAGDCSVKIDHDTRRCIYTGKEFEETLSLLISKRCDDCPLIEVKLVDQEEVIMPLNMIGGYLEKAEGSDA